ncbi:SpoIIE family protein phosphatase [Streptomyces cinnamoneus]|uniref:SpoIIE family protein phosphatase n=1 Tax=Streptomyces cinnamoneus TaxID=53446 RepID=UPI00378BEAAC
MRRHPDADAASGSGLEQLDAVLAGAVRDTGASIGLVYLPSPGERVLRLTQITGAPRQITAPWARIAADAPIPVADAIRDRRLVWLSSQEEVARRYPRLGIVLPYDFMLAASPIDSGGTVWGGIVLLWPVRHPPRLSAHERDTVTTCCRRAGDLLRRAADRGEPLAPPDEPRLVPLRRREADPAQATAAFDFAERLPLGCCALDLDGRITFINSAGADLVGAGTASLLGQRPWEALPWLNEPVFEDRYRAAVVSRQPTSFTALRPPRPWLHFELYPNGSGISVHISPADTGQTVTGADDAAAAERTKAAGRTTAAASARPLRQAEPVGATALYHLTHLAASVAEAVGVKDVVELVADQIVPAFGPQGLTLMTVEEGRLRIAGYRGYSSEFIDHFDGAPLDSDVPPAQAVVTGVPVFFASFADFRGAYPAAPRYGTRNAWAFLPLIASGRPVGSLVLSYDQPRPFSPAERALLTSLAGLIAQALDRARLYDAQHALVHSLQTGLLPRTLPRVPDVDVAARYLPASHGTDIGGDFYDLIHCGPATVVAAIGDVQGHNSTAAALMGQVRTAVHAHATAGTPPGDVLARTNRLLTDLDTGLFTSCLIARLDLARHRAHFATAGHPPPLLCSPDRRTRVLDLPPGLLLGIDPDADYATTEVPLPPGTVLALYTDGLVEIPGTDIDDTIAGLAEHLARAEDHDLDGLADTLIRQAEDAAPRTDDIALLLIRPQQGPS